MSMTANVSVGIQPWLISRAERAGVTPTVRVSQELQIFHRLLQAELQRTVWSELQMTILATLTTADLSDEVGLQWRWLARREFLRPMFPDDESVAAFHAKVTALSPTEDHALLDALSQWWHSPDRDRSTWKHFGIQVDEY